MTETSPSRVEILTDPFQLPASELEYYRTVWKFDPINDCLDVGENRRGYEVCIPLTQDPPLLAVGITICARVDWSGAEIHNRIVFQRCQQEAAVECTHTIVYAGPATHALTFASDEYTEDGRLSEVDREWMKRAGGPVPLPPWEHYAALKSYVGAIAEVGITAMFRATLPREGEDTPDTPEAPFGFNSAMRSQVLNALTAIAPEATQFLRRDLARELLGTAPTAWILQRWEQLAPIYPLRDSLATDPDFFVEWLKAWISEDPFRSLFTFSYPAKKDLGDLLLQEWPRVVRAWPPTLLMSVFRSSDLLDCVQENLFSNLVGDPVTLTRAKTEAPAIPWDQLRVEWQARQAAKDFVEDARELAGDDWSDIVDHLKDIPAAEVWPRVFFFVKEFPQILRHNEHKPGLMLAARRARVQRFLEEAIQHYEMTKDDEGGDIEWMVGWARQSQGKLTSDLARPFSTDWDNPFPKSPQDGETLRQYVLQGNTIQRRAAAQSPGLPQELQEKLSIHWDFATRLALAANTYIASPVLDMLAQDVQPCVRLLVETRRHRGSSEITPLMGEILSPGEILWLLVAHPRIFFFFGISTYGDGSQEYANWLENHFATRGSFLRKNVGEVFAWAYAEGGLFQATPRNTRAFDASHLALQGFTRYACGWLPCLYIKDGPQLGSGIGSPFNLWYSHHE